MKQEENITLPWAEYWRSLSRTERDEICKKVGCSKFHLRNIGKDGKRASPELAIKIERECGYPKEVMRPDIFLAA